MRLFVAVETGSATRAAPEHLTLAFLGEGPVERVAAVTRALTPVATDHPPFDLVLEGVGMFPSPERPRTVWIGVTTGRAALEELATAVRAALERERVVAAAERFVPHVTWFRVRSPADRRRARAILDGVGPTPPPRSVLVREFVLKESERSPRAVIHRTIVAFPLCGTGVPATDQPARAAESSTSFRQR